jgi:hypothetical protein
MTEVKPMTTAALDPPRSPPPGTLVQPVPAKEASSSDPKPTSQHDHDKWMAWAALSGNPHVAMQSAEDNANPTLIHCMGNIMWGALASEDLPDPPPPDPPPEVVRSAAPPKTPPAARAE